MLKTRAALLTGTIDSGVFHNTGNRIINIEERLKQYQNSITNYIENSAFDIIIFGENSGYPFNYQVFEKLAEKNGKCFEYVRCPGYIEGTIKHGKSYGEARLIEDTLERSRLLMDQDCIYKLTGRIFLRNSEAICRTMNRMKNEFIIYKNKQWCLTNIFKFSKKDYLSYWKNVYNFCDEKSGKDIEVVFFEIIESAVKKGLEVGSFSVWPYFDGIQGATLESYTGNICERTLRTVMCKCGFFTYGTFLSDILRF